MATAGGGNANARLLPNQQVIGARPGWVVFAWVAVCLVLASLVRWSLNPWLYGRGSYGVYFMAAVTAAWFGGWLAGTLAHCVGALLGTTFFSLAGVSSANDPSYLIGLFFYLIAGEIVITLVSAQRYQSQRADRSAAEAAAQREWLDAVLAGIGDGVIVLDAENRVIDMNRIAEKLTGWPTEEAIGRPLTEVARFVEEKTLAPADYGVLDPDSTDSSEIVTEPMLLLSRDRHEFAVDVRRTWIRDAADQITGCALAIRDETARRNAERTLRQSEANFRDLADNISQFAWMADETGYILWYNQRWFDYTGTTLESMKGWGWKAVHHPDHYDRVVRRFREHLDSGEAWEDTFPLRGRNGEYRWFLSRARPVRDESGRIIRWFGTNTDITDQRQLEDALREADKLKDDYLALLAHELRNPLAAVRSTIDALRLSEASAADLVKVTDDLSRQVGQIVHLIDDLLDVSRIGLGKITLQRRLVDLHDVLRTTLAIAMPRIEARGHHLTTSVPEEAVWLDADPARLAQAFSNILINAAKYTDPGGQLALRVEVHGSSVIVCVKDNGVGLEADMLQRIFAPFQQVKSSIDRTEGGLGLGLTLVKQLVELHGGSVSAHSEGLGHGSEFLMRLPIVESSVKASPAGGGGAIATCDRATNSKPQKILIADDNQAAANALAKVVHLLGYEVSVVFDGLAARDALLADPVDIAILDIGMPKLNGHEVARSVRAARPGDGPVLVAVSGWGRPDDRQRSREAGFDFHLVKPVPLDTLRAILDGADEMALAAHS